MFHDEPNQRESYQQDVVEPIYRERDGSNLNRDDNPVILGSGPLSLGPESDQRIHPQDIQPHNTPGQAGAVSNPGAIPRSITSARVRGSGMGRTGSVLSEPGPHRLSTPIIPCPTEVPSRRIADMNISPSLEGITEDISGQNQVEEKLERFQQGMVTLTTTVQGAEFMYRLLQGDIEDLKSNSDEVWQRLMSD